MTPKPGSCPSCSRENMMPRLMVLLRRCGNGWPGSIASGVSTGKMSVRKRSSRSGELGGRELLRADDDDAGPLERGDHLGVPEPVGDVDERVRPLADGDELLVRREAVGRDLGDGALRLAPLIPARSGAFTGPRPRGFRAYCRDLRHVLVVCDPGPGQQVTADLRALGISQSGREMTMARRLPWTRTDYAACREASALPDAERRLRAVGNCAGGVGCCAQIIQLWPVWHSTSREAADFFLDSFALGLRALREGIAHRTRACADGSAGLAVPPGVATACAGAQNGDG